MKKWLIRISLGVVTLTLVGAVATYVVIDGTIDTMFGHDTPRVAFDPADSPERYVLTPVSVLSAHGDAFIPDQAVVIESGEITAVGPMAATGDDLEIVDGGGLYLVPGFTDSHVHLWDSPNDLLLYLANGVTQVREMHGLPVHLEWKREIEQGRPGPDLFVVASQFTTNGFWDGLWNAWTSKRNVVRSPEAAVRKVAQFDALGFDAVKAGSHLSAESHAAVGQATAQADLPYVGHLPVEVDLDALWTTNQKELAHIEELVKGLARQFGRFNADSAEAFLEHVRERRDEVARRTAEAGITVVSTLALSESFRPQIVELQPTLASVALEYVNPGVAEGQAMGWLPGVHRYGGGHPSRDEEWLDRQTRYWDAYAEAHRLMLEALLRFDVTILTGTDASVPVMVPGFSMHREMRALVDAGMSPARVLAAATSEAGDWMNWNTGRVEAGYRANLVLLRENPLDDIDATRSIEQVIVRGRIHDREALDRMLDAVAQANASVRYVPIGTHPAGAPEG